MKKWSSGVLSCILAFSGVGFVASLPYNTFNRQQVTTQAEVNDVAQIGYTELAKLISRSDASLNAKGQYKMKEDIDCKNLDPSTFYDYGADKYFTGTFDGNGYTIKNLNLASNNGFYGLFPYAKDVVIKNLKIQSTSLTFDKDYTGDIYGGILVGYGENVRFENCELILKTVDDVTGEENRTTINLASKNDMAEEPEDVSEGVLNSSTTFGLLAGKIDNGNLSNASNDAGIKNCVASANIQLTQSQDKFINVGGLVGTLKNGFISHSVFLGDINCSGTGSLSKNAGGIIGKVEGINAKVKNSCFEGNVGGGVYISKGNIVGGKDLADSPSDDNFDFCYWTGLNNYGIGGSSYSKNTFINTSSISKDFLTQEGNFDPTLVDWNFDDIWSGKNGVLRLQNFMEFSLSLNTPVDVAEVFSAKIKATTESSVTKRYGEKVEFDLTITSAKQDWFVLDGVLLYGSLLSSQLYSVSGNGIDGYTISVQANALTEGAYSFRAKELRYTGKIETEVEDEPDAVDFGGVKIKGASSTSLSLPLDFSNASQEKVIEAVGKGKYVFKAWELYYKNGSVWQKQTGGEFNGIGSGNSVNIHYTPNSTQAGNIFNQEFKLVAVFTKNAKTITIGKYEKNHIKSIKINGEDILNSDVEVAANSSQVSLEIVTKSAIVDVDKFIQDFNNAYAKDGIETWVAIEKISEQKNEDLQEMTYTFKINMNGIDFNKLEGDQTTIPLSFSTSKIRMSDKNLLWLYILAPVGGILIVGIIIFALKKKHGGKTKPKQGKKVSQTKKTDYKDYYI